MGDYHNLAIIEELSGCDHTDVENCPVEKHAKIADDTPAVFPPKSYVHFYGNYFRTPERLKNPLITTEYMPAFVLENDALVSCCNTRMCFILTYITIFIALISFEVTTVSCAYYVTTNEITFTTNTVGCIAELTTIITMGSILIVYTFVTLMQVMLRRYQ
jgi:3D (Asp-Asp-Asp) domain-containing protein